MRVRARVRGLTLVLTACVSALTLMFGGTSAGAAAASPSVTSAAAGVITLPGFTSFDPTVVGYEKSEVVLSGTASAYEPAAPLGTDGKYSVAATSTAAYTTRAVVMRPINARVFNGTVVVEWLNVSGGADAAPDWMLAHNQLVREGFVWVGVSAQTSRCGRAQVGRSAAWRSGPLRQPVTPG